MLSIRGRKVTPLHEAARTGNMGEARRLLENGADAGALTSSKESPLHFAAAEGHLEIIKMLLERNINLNGRDYSGWTPLFCAASRGHLEVVKLLLEHGASPQGVDTDGRSILDVCAKYTDVFELLASLVGAALRRGATRRQEPREEEWGTDPGDAADGDPDESQEVDEGSTTDWEE